MREYTATFFSHFGALSYFDALKNQNITAQLMPVPRSVSASCGTCVFYAFFSPVDKDDCELDSVYVKINGKWDCVLKK